ETVVLKAMAKNPAERYATAQDLAEDLRRFLEDKPIRARRPTLRQRAVTWSRRHKPVVVAVGVSTAVAAVLVIALLVLSNLRINGEKNQKDIALQEKETALGNAEAQREKAEKAHQAARTHLRKACE